MGFAAREAAAGPERLELALFQGVRVGNFNGQASLFGMVVLFGY